MNKLDVIYIPTLGRLDRQITFNALPDKWKAITRLVVRPHEFEDARNICENTLCLPNDIQSISDTRRWIIEHAGNSRYAMIDDDITFWRRHCDRKTLKKNADKSNTLFIDTDFDELFESTVPRWFNEGVVVGGMNYKGKPPASTSESQFGKIISVFFINGNLLNYKIDWSVEYGEDIHFILQVLRNGGKTRISDDFLYSTRYWEPGGCQHDGRRTMEAELDNLTKLVNLHKGYVEFGDKYSINTGVYKNNPVENVSIKVFWRKAYESSLKKWDTFI